MRKDINIYLSLRGQPGEGSLHRLDSGALGRGRAGDEDNGQAQRAGGDEFAVRAARILGHHHRNAIAFHEALLRRCIERAAPGEDAGARRQQPGLGRIDTADEVVVLRRQILEGGEILPPDGQKHPARGGPEGARASGNIIHLTPIIARRGLPAGPLQDEARDGAGGGGKRRIGGNPLGEGVGRVNQRGDALIPQVGGEPVGATKAADTAGDGRQDRSAGAPGEREDGVEPILARNPPGEGRGFRRAAEDEKPQW